MPLTRRHLLPVALGSGAILGLGGVILGRRYVRAWRPWTGPDGPYAAWDGPEPLGLTDPRLLAAAWARLAPSAHNLQPWHLQLEGNDRLTLFHDPARSLPRTDPLDRQATLSHGAFLEALRLAAAAGGHRLRAEPFPEGAPHPRLDRRPIARVTFEPASAGAADPLFPALRLRRTSRHPHDLQAPPPPLPAILAAAETAGAGAGLTLGGTTPADPALRDRLTRLALEAWRVEMTTPSIWAETASWLRIGEAEIAADPDGLAVRGAVVALGQALGQLTDADLVDPAGEFARVGLDLGLTQIGQTAGFGWIISPDNSRLSQLAAGAAYLRADLAATLAGDVALQPVSQALQEYPEMADLFAEVHAALQVRPPAVLQMLFRIGRPQAPTPPAPRRRLEALLLPA